MGIWKITEEQRENERLTVWVCGALFQGEKSLSVRTNIVPGFCLRCNEQIEGFFGYDGGRYGQVGAIACEKCSSVMGVTDRDGGPDYLYFSLGAYRNPFLKSVEKFGTEIPMLELDMEKLYKMTNESFELVKEKTGFNVFNKRKQVTLENIIEDICKRIGINMDEIPNQSIHASDEIKMVPDVVSKWFNLLKLLGDNRYEIIPQEPTEEEKGFQDFLLRLEHAGVKEIKLDYEGVERLLPVIQEFIEEQGFTGKLCLVRNEKYPTLSMKLWITNEDKIIELYRLPLPNEFSLGKFYDHIMETKAIPKRMEFQEMDKQEKESFQKISQWSATALF